MSHMVKVSDFEITSFSALQAACKRLGYELAIGQKTARYWNGNTAKVDHAIKIPGCSWEIGVVEEQVNGRKTYSLQADFYGSEGEKIKKAINQLRQMYAVELAKQVARRKGYTVREQKLADGKIKLVVGVR